MPVSVTLLGNEVFVDVIRDDGEWCALILFDWGPLRRRKFEHGHRGKKRRSVVLSPVCEFSEAAITEHCRLLSLINGNP